MEERYLITGACGHLGLNVVNELVNKGKRVRAFIMPNTPSEKYLPECVEKIYGDVTNNRSLLEFFKKEDGYEDIVIHCAGIVSVASKYDENVYNVNVVGVKNIVDLCLENRVKKLIYVSSVHAITEKPNNEVITETKDFSTSKVIGLYAKTKAEASSYVMESTKKGLNAVIVHPSGLFGPNDYGPGHLTALIIDYCNKKLTAAIKGGYDFVDVRDVVNGILLAIEKAPSGESYILSNEYYTIEEILNYISDITGIKKIKTYLPIWFAKLTAPLAETYYNLMKTPPLYTNYSLYTLESNSNFSHQKATSELGYEPRDIKLTLKDTVKFLKDDKKIK